LTRAGEKDEGIRKPKGISRAQAIARAIEGRTAALRFLFVKTLCRPYLPDHIPFPKRQRRLPTILDQQEVARLIDSAGNLMHRTMLMMLYATGLRRAEMCHLKVSPISTASAWSFMGAKATVSPAFAMHPHSPPGLGCVRKRRSVAEKSSLQRADESEAGLPSHSVWLRGRYTTPRTTWESSSAGPVGS
jgi:hypothetical protein